MDYNEKDSLALVECLLDEFFNPATSNARKHEIELQINSFKSSAKFWQFCLYYLNNTSNLHVIMLALSTLEFVVNHHWTGQDYGLNKHHLRKILIDYLWTKGNTAPHFICAKYIKLLVEIAKQDWGIRDDHFFPIILELLASEPYHVVGLALLRTTSQEMMGVHAQFDDVRRDIVTRMMHRYVREVFELIEAHVLASVAARAQPRTVTATPPPSPTHAGDGMADQSQQLATATFRPDTRLVKRELLATLQDLFMWVPIDKIPHGIIDAVFGFAWINPYDHNEDDICVSAISTINELLYRKHNLLGSREFFTRIYCHVVELFRLIHCNVLLDLVYVEKLCELLILLIEQHFAQFQMDPQFAPLQLLSFFYKMTMGLHSVECYLQCLTVWNVLIKLDKSDNVRRYPEVFSRLLDDLLNKLQFSFNIDQLKKINNVDPNDDNETNWQIFVKNTIETVSLVAEFAPLEIFDKVLVLWKSSFDLYRKLEGFVDFQNSSLNCALWEIERLFYTLRDFSTLTQTLATLSSLFFYQNDSIKMTSLPVLNGVIDQLIESISFSVSMKFYNLKLNNTSLVENFIDVYSELLVALKTFSIHIRPNNNKLTNDQLQRLIDVTVPILCKGDEIPMKISHSTAQLLLALTNQVLTPILITSNDMIRFIEIAPTLRFANNQTNLLINSIIVNLLLKHWRPQQQQQQDTTQRQYLINYYFNALTGDFRQLVVASGNNCDLQHVKNVVDNVLPALSYTIDYSQDLSIVSKKMLYNALKDTIDYALVLYPSYVNCPEVTNNMLVLFLNVLRVLQQQFGADNIDYALHVFLQAALTDNSSLLNLEKLLQVLQFVIETPGSQGDKYVQQSLKLSLEQIYPFVLSQAPHNADIFVALLTLLYSIMLHRWHYLWPSIRMYGEQHNNSNSNSFIDDDDLVRKEELFGVLEIFGAALTQSDINVFRLSLTALEGVNAKWHLYEKILYYPYLERFVNVLLRTLVERVHTLLSEDIQVALYRMNFPSRSSGFFVKFVDGIKGLTKEQHKILKNRVFEGNFLLNITDMPTFVRGLQKFVSDIQNYNNLGPPESCQS